MNIQLPPKKGTPITNPSIDIKQLVIVGANGSGKTRFGSNIEQRYLAQTHRISAQKSLTFPAEVTTKSKKRAENELYYGMYHETYNDAQLLVQKQSSRWGGKFNTYLLNDYDKLLVLLHTEEYEEALNFKEGRLNSRPITKLDKVQSIWEAVLPHRKLFKRAAIIETYVTGQEQKKYSASEMSDGERVIFYLIGEVVCAPKNNIIIIDEPEMHIHKSLLKNLFDLIEIERPDCSFIYLTHDIDFAFSRQSATKIWAKSYEGNNVWDYEILGNDMPVPEQLYLEILGSRKSVIFIEGENSSIDYLIYEQVFRGYTIKPLGSCDSVIHCVKSFNGQNTFHHIQSNGIVDRDRRLDDEISKLLEKGVWVLNVAEAENLLLIDSIIRIVAKHMQKDPEAISSQVKENLMRFFSEELPNQITLHLKERLRREFNKMSEFNSKNILEIDDEINALYKSIDKEKIFNSIKSRFEDAVNFNDYDSMLKLFNLKNALIPKSKVCDLTGIRNKEEYQQLVLNLLKGNDAVSEQIRKEIDDWVIK